MLLGEANYHSKIGLVGDSLKVVPAYYTGPRETREGKQSRMNKHSAGWKPAAKMLCEEQDLQDNFQHMFFAGIHRAGARKRVVFQVLIVSLPLVCSVNFAV